MAYLAMIVIGLILVQLYRKQLRLEKQIALTAYNVVPEVVSCLSSQLQPLVSKTCKALLFEPQPKPKTTLSVVRET